MAPAGRPRLDRATHDFAMPAYRARLLMSGAALYWAGRKDMSHAPWRVAWQARGVTYRATAWRRRALEYELRLTAVL
jgi:hypothetical protein